MEPKTENKENFKQYPQSVVCLKLVRNPQVWQKTTRSLPVHIFSHQSSWWGKARLLHTIPLLAASHTSRWHWSSGERICLKLSWAHGAHHRAPREAAVELEAALLSQAVTGRPSLRPGPGPAAHRPGHDTTSVRPALSARPLHITSIDSGLVSRKTNFITAAWKAMQLIFLIIWYQS